MSVLCHAERAHETGAVLVITTAEEMIHGTDTGIVGVERDVDSLGVSTLHVHVVASYLVSIAVFLKILHCVIIRSVGSFC